MFIVFHRKNVCKSRKICSSSKRGFFQGSPARALNCYEKFSEFKKMY